MKYFLDTNMIIYALKGTYPALKAHFSQIPAQAIVIPAVVSAEIEYGARRSRDYKKTIHQYRLFMNAFEEIPFGSEAVVYYGQIRSLLEKKGMVIGANDLLIAATVLAENGILVTHNTKEFERIPGLKLEDWTE